MKNLKIIVMILNVLIFTVGCSNPKIENLEKMNDEYLETISMLEINYEEDTKDLNNELNKLEEEKNKLNSRLEELKVELEKSSKISQEDFPEVYSMGEEKLNNLVDEAIEICKMFNVGMIYDYNSMIEIDGVSWCKTQTSNFSNMEELESYLSNIFVEDIVYGYYNINQRFQDVDNVLYTSMLGEMGSLVIFSDKTPRLIRVNLQEQKLIYSKECFDDFESLEEHKPSNFEIEIVYIEGQGFRLNSVINVY